MIDGNIRMTRDMIEPFEQLKCPIYFHYVYCNSGQGTSGPCVRSFCKSQIGIIKLEGENKEKI